MYADETGHVKNPNLALQWVNVRDAALSVNRFCIEAKRMGGLWIVRGKSAFVPTLGIHDPMTSL